MSILAFVVTVLIVPTGPMGIRGTAVTRVIAVALVVFVALVIFGSVRPGDHRVSRQGPTVISGSVIGLLASPRGCPTEGAAWFEIASGIPSPTAPPSDEH
ncbi:MAG: hypothetical protein ABIO99_07200 [Candidatus Limnocylindria bacterium]